MVFLFRFRENQHLILTETFGTCPDSYRGGLLFCGPVVLWSCGPVVLLSCGPMVIGGELVS